MARRLSHIGESEKRAGLKTRKQEGHVCECENARGFQTKQLRASALVIRTTTGLSLPIRHSSQRAMAHLVMVEFCFARLVGAIDQSAIEHREDVHAIIVDFETGQHAGVSSPAASTPCT